MVARLFVLGLAFLLGSGCYAVRKSSGGGQTTFSPPRRVDTADIALPAGYRIEKIAEGLTFPTGVAEDRDGNLYVVESGYCYGEVFTEPRLVRVRDKRVIATGTRNGPWNGVAFHNGNFYVAEGGVLQGGKILRITPDGKITALLTNLPSFGDHHTDGPVIGPDGRIYFGQGTASNSGIIGKDNVDFGWVKRFPNFHDIPGADITLADDSGAFVPMGTKTHAGQVIKGQTIASGSIISIDLNGGDIRQVAWGLRNPFGLAFSPEGRLFVTDNGYDDRGARGVWGSSDFLWAVTNRVWYGWPDYVGGRPITEPDFAPRGKPRREFILAKHPNQPPKPVAMLGVHAAASGLDFSKSQEFGYSGDAFVALFGDMAPGVGKTLHPVGFKVVRVDIDNGVIQDFAVNRGKKNAPATYLKTGGLERPVAVKFSNDGKSLYVVDFGVMVMKGKKPDPQKETGVIWRISRTGGAR